VLEFGQITVAKFQIKLGFIRKQNVLASVSLSPRTCRCPLTYVYAGNPIIITGFVVFNAIFNNISDISCGQFYLWRKPKYPEKTTDLPIRIRENNSIVFKILVIC
jgi:hypothetical protein